MNERVLRKALLWIVGILRRHTIPFQISGGLAAHAYGAKRAIHDIDIDVPEEMMENILPDVKQFIEFGPARYKDERWDLLLMTLDYKGQLIDVGGANDTRICDARTSEWNAVPCDLSSARTMKIFDIELTVVNPEHLMIYKQMLTGRHQQEDIAALRAYFQTRRIGITDKTPRRIQHPTSPYKLL